MLKHPVYSRTLVSILALTLLALPLAAQTIPLTDWAIPSHGTMQKGSTVAGNPVAFIKVSPCRVYDSRSSGPATPLAAATPRTINVPGGGCAGIPTNSIAYSLNFTVFGSTATSSYAFLTAYPTGTTRPTVSTLNFLTGSQTSNAAIVPAGTSGQVDLYSTVTTDFTMDINGYFTDTPDPGYQFVVNANVGNLAAIVGYNSNTTTGSHGVGGFAGGAGVVFGVQGQAGSATLSGSAGVHAIQDSPNASWGVLANRTPTTPTGFGGAVRGVDASTNTNGIGGWFTTNGGGYGAAAQAGTGGIGMYGSSSGGYAVWGAESTGIAVFGQQSSTTAAAGAAAIVGTTGSQTTNRTYAVKGTTGSTASDSAGVLGVEASGAPAWWPRGTIPAGVLGLSKSNIGVIGSGEYMGVAGIRTNADGTGDVEGYLGFGTSGVYSFGPLTATGTKSFVDPHPTDPNLVVKFVALEGPEAGTYFRGRAQFVNHHAVIQVPESFRLSTDADGLTVNITPMGGIASVGVMKADLDTIEVESTKDVQFSYLVQGVRKPYKDWQAIQKGDDFAPRGPDAHMPGGLNAEQRQRLIDNGTYNADGSVNMSTAERLGWAQKWRDREAEQQKHNEDVAKQQALDLERTSQLRQQQ